MKTISPMFVLAVLFASAFAFDPTIYLIGNETNASITKESFKVNNVAYYIATISGNPTFLVKGDDLVDVKSEIDAVLKQYYSAKYFLSLNETNQLYTNFLAYNTSRNNGYKFPGKEEYSCRQAIFLERRECAATGCCINNETCYNTTRLFCAYSSKATGCNDPDMFLKNITDFAYASNDMEKVMKDIFSKLGSLNADNALNYLTQIRGYLPTIKSDQKAIEGTIFRTPLTGSECPKCIGFCPDINLDENALKSAELALNTSFTKISSFAQYKNISDRIYANTNGRLDEKVNSAVRVYYTALFAPAEKAEEAVENKTAYALTLVDNATVKTKLAQLEAMEKEIEKMISDNNFSSVNASIASYIKATASLNASADRLITVYNTTSQAYKIATVYLFLAEGKSMSPEDMRNISMASQRKAKLDLSFKPGLTETQYKDIQGQYNSLISDERQIVNKISKEQGIYLFTGMGNKFVDGLEMIIRAGKPLSYSERAALSSYAPIGLSVLLFGSFSAMVLFLFLLYYASAHKPMNKALLVVLALFLIFLVGLVSMSIFLSLDKSFNRLDYSEFLDMLKYSKNAAIVLQKSGNEDNATLAAMKTCALNIKNAMGKANMSSTQYNFTHECTAASASCPLDSVYHPIIILRYASMETSSYSGLLARQATISGPQQYYEICPMGEALRMDIG